MTFWIIAALMAAIVAATLVLALLRGKAGAEPTAAYDLRVYRRQIQEIDRDLARGVIAEADADRIRAEVARRILAADTQLQQHKSGATDRRGLTGAVAVLVVAIVLGGGTALYWILGAPGYQDLPMDRRLAMAAEREASRPGQAEAESAAPPRPAPKIDDTYKALLKQLRAKVAERPDDLQGHILLARHEANVGNFAAASRAMNRAIVLLGDKAGTNDYTEQAELMILAADGYVSPEAEAALKAALSRDPHYGPARYYWGLMQAQLGRPDLAFATWETTLRQGPADAPWLKPIRAQIEDMAWRAGVRYSLPEQPAQANGPSAADMAAAKDMTPDDRQAMIKGMVDRLAGRLAEKGGTASEWARLINALGVLGDTDRAAKALADARAAHANDPAALAEIEAAAKRAGLTGGGSAPTESGALPGPDAQQVQDAAKMDGGDRQAMIRGMVQRLSDRLASNGGSAQEWARLITSLGVLGDTEAATKALADARAAYAKDPAALTKIAAAAKQAGLIQ